MIGGMTMDSLPLLAELLKGIAHLTLGHLVMIAAGGGKIVTRARVERIDDPDQ